MKSNPSEIIISDQISIFRKFGGILVTEDCKFDLKVLGGYATWYCQIENPRLISNLGVLILLASNYGYQLNIAQTNAYGTADWSKLCQHLLRVRSGSEL